MATERVTNRFPQVERRMAAVGALLLLLTLYLTSNSTYFGRSHPPAARQPQPRVAAAPVGPLESSAAAALASDRPILFVFIPETVCQRRYCMTAELVARQVAEKYGDLIGVVAVPVRTIPFEVEGERPDHVDAVWNLYTVPPYSQWLPDAERTVDGWGLTGPTVVLVKPDGAVLGRYDEFFDVSGLGDALDARP